MRIFSEVFLLPESAASPHISLAGNQKQDPTQETAYSQKCVFKHLAATASELVELRFGELKVINEIGLIIVGGSAHLRVRRKLNRRYARQYRERD